MHYNTDSNTNSALSSVFNGEGVLLPRDEQNALIERVRANDSEAFLILAASHARTLRKHRALAIKAGVDKDEAEEIVLIGFTEAVIRQDEETYAGTLAAAVKTRIIEALDRHYAENNTPFTISRTHYNRYKSLVNAHGGDVAAAYEATEDDPNMRPATFLAIHRAVQGTSLDAANSDEEGLSTETSTARPVTRVVDDSFAEAEDAALVRAAFDAVNDEEERIIAMHYGFRGVKRDDLGLDYATGEVIPDAAIAKVIGSSQPTVNRRRASGLGKMRKALGVVPVTPVA